MEAILREKDPLDPSFDPSSTGSPIHERFVWNITSKRCSVQWQLPRVGCEFWTAYGGWTLAICKKRFASRHSESRGRAGHEGITLCSRLSTRETRTTMFFAYAQLVYRTEPKSKSATFASCRVGEDTSGVHVATGWSACETGTKERPLEVESLAGVESRCRDEPAPFSRELPLIGEGRKVIGVGCLPKENRKLIALGLEVCDLGNSFIFREDYVFRFDVVPRHLYRRVKWYDQRIFNCRMELVKNAKLRGKNEECRLHLKWEILWQLISIYRSLYFFLFGVVRCARELSSKQELLRGTCFLSIYLRRRDWSCYENILPGGFDKWS